jgi:hypothetical protein
MYLLKYWQLIEHHINATTIKPVSPCSKVYKADCKLS